MDTTPTVQADERIEAENPVDAFIAWLAIKDSWLEANDGDRHKIHAMLNQQPRGTISHFESDTKGSDWEFGLDSVEGDECCVSLAGTSCMGEFEFEIEIKQFVDKSEIDNGLFVRDPASLKYESLLEIVRWCQCGLFMEDVDGRETWVLDKDMPGSDFIEHIGEALARHKLIPEEAK